MSEPRVLLIDIETAPLVGYAWSKWETNIIDTIKDFYILSFAYKWIDDKKVRSLALPDFPLYKKDPENDLQLCHNIWPLLNQADIVVAHNGDSFDIKKINARFLVHGTLIPSPYKTIDTKKIAKKYFKFDSNKLDELGRQLGIGRKMQHGGFELWKGCMSGDTKSWKTMVEYNKQDVELLEKVFLKLRPWMNNFPVVRSENGDCRNCEGSHLQKRGFSFTRTSKIQRLQCQDCGAWNLGTRVLAKE